jgi:prepilin-type N-terminal cleavage/methylation domain-containing protein
MKKLLKSQKGMTLIELVVGMVMFAIAVGAVGAILAPTLRVYAEANEYAESNNLLDTLANQILDDLSEATTAPTINAEGRLEFYIDTRKVTYWVDQTAGGANEGLLMRQYESNEEDTDEKPVYTEPFYKGKSLAFAVDTDEAPVYTLTLSISGGISISRTYAVRPVAVTITPPSPEPP